MKLNKQQLSILLAKYNSQSVAAKMLRKVSECSPEQIGRSLLSTKTDGQRLINLERTKH